MHTRSSAAAVAAAVFAAAFPAAALGPRAVGYQGRLLRADGTAATGTATVAFGVWDTASGGSQLWTESQTLGLSDGYYSTFLGLVLPPPDGLFDGSARWLEIRVGSETLVPRQQIGAAPYALAAQSVAGGVADVSSLRVGGELVVDADGRLAGPARYAAGSGIEVDDATRTLSLQACATGQVLVRDATAWQCVAANPGTVISVAALGPLTVTNPTSAPQISLPQAGSASNGYLSSSDWSSFNARFGAASATGGDLSGPVSAPVVVRLQSRPVATAAPQDGQILKWDALQSQWKPSTDADSGGTLTGITARPPLTAWTSSTQPVLELAAARGDADGYLSSSDWQLFDGKYDAATQCGGDLWGSLSAPLVTKLRGVPVSTTVPSAAQVLRFDGTRWEPQSLGISDVGGPSSGYVDLAGTQTISGSKTFSSAPQFGTPLGVASGGIGGATAPQRNVFAGPASGTGAPGFRALDAADLPSLDVSKLSTGTLSVARGGTGLGYGPAAHQFLRDDGAGAWTAGAIAASDLPSLSDTYALASHLHGAGDLTAGTCTARSRSPTRATPSQVRSPAAAPRSRRSAPAALRRGPCPRRGCRRPWGWPTRSRTPRARSRAP